VEPTSVGGSSGASCGRQHGIVRIPSALSTPVSATDSTDLPHDLDGPLEVPLGVDLSHDTFFVPENIASRLEAIQFADLRSGIMTKLVRVP
jgi:hypothetical protein